MDNFMGDRGETEWIGGWGYTNTMTGQERILYQLIARGRRRYHACRITLTTGLGTLFSKEKASPIKGFFSLDSQQHKI